MERMELEMCQTTLDVGREIEEIRIIEKGHYRDLEWIRIKEREKI